MIEINLLPETMRRKEPTPLPQFITLIAGIAVIGFLGFTVARYMTVVIPTLETRKLSLQNQKAGLQAEAEELKRIQADIARLSDHVEAVKTLYRQRIIWSRLLSDFKNMVNFDPVMNGYNSDMRYLWITKLGSRGTTIDMDGFATASNPVDAMDMPSRFIKAIREYSPQRLPEKDEETRLQAELRQAIADNELFRRDNPDAPVRSEREISIRQRLADISAIKSGGIALLPFRDFLRPGPEPLRLLDATWTGAPQPRRTAVAVASAQGGNSGAAAAAAAQEEVFPRQAWAFKISMELRPPGQQE